MFNKYYIPLGLLIAALLFFILSLILFLEFIPQATVFLLGMALLCSVYKPRKFKVLHRKTESKKFDPSIMLRQDTVKGKIVEFKPRVKGQK